MAFRVQINLMTQSTNKITTLYYNTVYTCLERLLKLFKKNNACTDLKNEGRFMPFHYFEYL